MPPDISKKNKFLSFIGKQMCEYEIKRMHLTLWESKNYETWEEKQVAGLFYMMLSKIKINLKQMVSPKTALKQFLSNHSFCKSISPQKEPCMFLIVARS